MTGAVVAPAAKADIIHTISASTQLRVDAAATDATRIGSSYTVQGTNITSCGPKKRNIGIESHV